MIKKIFRSFVSNGIALFVATFFLDGFNIEMNLITFATVAGALVLVDFIVKPIVKVISFPINAVTLGVFGWFLNAILLFFVVYLIDGLAITEGYLKLDILGPLTLTVPNIYLGVIMTLIVASFIISVVKWLLSKILF